MLLVDRITAAGNKGPVIDTVVKVMKRDSQVLGSGSQGSNAGGTLSQINKYKVGIIRKIHAGGFLK